MADRGGKSRTSKTQTGSEKRRRSITMTSEMMRERQVKHFFFPDDVDAFGIKFWFQNNAQTAEFFNIGNN